MTLDLSTFKSALGDLSNTSVAYIDEEGSEIPIDSECEFQEALRLARLNKTSLKLVFYCAEPELNEIMYFDRYDFGSNPTGKFSGLVRKTRRTHGDVAPEWFTDYMKKFRKELLHEMKSYINETVHSAVAKEKRKSEKQNWMTVGEICGLQERKKKKVLERDLTDLIDQRQMRLPKKFYASKNESLHHRGEILDMGNDDLLPESNHHSKSKSDRICSLMYDEISWLKKSASFEQNNMCLSLPLGSDFTVPVQVVNDGKMLWSVPYLECFEYKGLVLFHEYRKSLPKLYPAESCLVLLQGKLSDEAGVHYFKCKVVDGLERLGPVFTCSIRVSSPTSSVSPVSPVKSPQKFPSDSAGVRESVAVDSGLQVGTLIDLEKNLITTSQKKIEENINEIERRLRDIDLLQPSTCSEHKSGNGEETEGKLLVMDICATQWADLHLCDYDTADEVSTSQLRKEEGSKETEVVETEDLLMQHSDSDLSIVRLSEEDENFLVVPAEGLSSAESANEDKKSSIAEPKENGAEFNEQPAKPEIQNESLQRQADRDEASACVEDLHPSRASPTRSRWSLFGEDFSKPKKMKSKSSEYRFKAANLTQPTFRKLEGRPSRFTFTGEKEAKAKKSNKQRFKGTNPPFGQSPGFEGNRSAFTFTGEKEKSNENEEVPKTDALGRVIYAVNGSGCCIPAESLPKCGESSGSQRTQPRQTYPPNDMSNVGTFPNALANVVSIAFDTAKNVINNLQSALVKEGKTVMGQPAYEDPRKTPDELMDWLWEMGYSNVELNRVLLLLHENNIVKVVEQLVALEENSP